jgi:sugar/nucleoside kinase (ribokinase family)
MVADLDAIYVNFISGFEMCLGTAGALRHGFAGPIYADFHSLFLGTAPDGIRVLRPLANAREWFACFDSVQMNEDEMRQIGADPMAVAAIALEAGVSLLNVTLGARGVAYVAAAHQVPVRTARIAAPAVDALDPTGCGDVFGATCFARMLAGDPFDTALGAAVVAASRNVGYRGATGLADHLRGRLVVA